LGDGCKDGIGDDDDDDAMMLVVVVVVAQSFVATRMRSVEMLDIFHYYVDYCDVFLMIRIDF